MGWAAVAAGVYRPNEVRAFSALFSLWQLGAMMAKAFEKVLF